MSEAASAKPALEDGAVVQIVGPGDGWILERLARTLASKLPYAVFVPWAPQPSADTCLVYYVNYALFNQPSGLLDVVFFTHPDETHLSVERVRRADACVCMARQYAAWLAAQGIRTVTHIPMGFDSYRYRPRLLLGVIGRLEHPRKGRALVDQVRELPFVEIVTTEGRLATEDLRALYERLDYVFIPATVEGGPLCLLEGLSMGKPVIAPEGVGLTPEFGSTEQLLLYPAGDATALTYLLTECYRAKQTRARIVRDRSWDRWAEQHHHYFMQLLRSRGVRPPTPALGFRFGMLGELTVPPGLDTTTLEAAIDQAARHLFFGRYGAARTVLTQMAGQHSFVNPLLSGIPVR